MKTKIENGIRPTPAARGLCAPRFEHDACGVSMVCHLKGEKSHRIIADGLKILVNLTHRGACGCDETTGDAHRGQSLIVWAISEGREAAHCVDLYLMGTSELPAKGGGDLPIL